MNSCLYVASRPRALARMLVSLVVPSGVGLSRPPGAGSAPTLEARGRYWEVEALTERGAPAPWRSEAVSSEMGGRSNGRES